LDEFLGRQETVVDVLRPTAIEGLAATLEMQVPSGGLPPLWHAVMFPQWVRPSEARADGGIRAGGFLPPFDGFPRRVAAGTRTQFHRALRANDEVTRISRIARIQEKTGRSGKLVLLTLERTFSVSRLLAVSEEHDYLYMGEQPHAGTSKPLEAVREIPASAISRKKSVDSVALFQYSALVGVSHRIHYDLDYARNVEGYPGLLVHGPLRALWLTSLIPSLLPGKPIAAVDFRHLKPAYHTEQFTLAVWEDEAFVRMELRNSRDEVCTQGTATLGGVEAAPNGGPRS
jgi:hydroxyacyl-ACP dehydratase HTD2-like protein with hotdog domain